MLLNSLKVEIKISIHVGHLMNSHITLHFRVEDTGIGMHQHEVEKLFQSSDFHKQTSLQHVDMVALV